MPRLRAPEDGTAECAEDAETHPAFRGASCSRGMGILTMTVDGFSRWRDATAPPRRGPN